MSVYQRNGNELYSYDFRLEGVRYSGSTGTTNLEEARTFERMMKAEVASFSSFCRTILRRAKRNLPGKTKSRSGYVYMVRSGYFIKIGHSVDPEERIRTINTSNPGERELLFCTVGTMQMERELHREFEGCHYQKEWFFLCGKLKKFVEELKRRDALPATRNAA